MWAELVEIGRRCTWRVLELLWGWLRVRIAFEVYTLWLCGCLSLWNRKLDRGLWN